MFVCTPEFPSFIAQFDGIPLQIRVVCGYAPDNGVAFSLSRSPVVRTYVGVIGCKTCCLPQALSRAQVRGRCASLRQNGLFPECTHCVQVCRFLVETTGLRTESWDGDVFHFWKLTGLRKSHSSCIQRECSGTHVWPNFPVIAVAFT